MRDRIRICVLTMALALAVVVAPAQAWPGADNGDRPVVSLWAAVVEALAGIFAYGTDNPPQPLSPQGDGSCMIDPQGGCRS